MQALAFHAGAREGGREAARTDLLERRLARYQPHFQLRVRAVAGRHSRLKDLAASFPALLFALAVPRGGMNVERTIARAIDGAPLRELAELSGVPLWLRPVGPAAFAAPIPALPNDQFFRRQIRNYLPVSHNQFGVWVQAVSDACTWSDQAVALWIARELRLRRKKVKIERLRGVCLWVWYSRNVRGEGICATEKNWEPSFAFDKALELSFAWLRRLDLHLNLGDEPVPNMWFKPDTVNGYEFVPLSSAFDIAAEAAAMRHCVLDYGDNVAQDMSRLWSVRRDGRRVGTLEIGFPNGDPLPSVAQITSEGNGEVALQVWVAARRWLNAHDVELFSNQSRSWDTVPLRRAAWLKLWRPYWLAKQSIPSWLPLSPSRTALYQLRHGGPYQRVRRRRRRLAV